MAVQRPGCSILMPLRMKRSCKPDLDPHQFLRRLSGSWFLLLVVIVLLSIHVRTGASTSCDDSRGPSLELGLERTTALSRRRLAVNLTKSLLEDGEALLRIKANILTDPLNVTYWWKRSGANKALNPCRMRNWTAQYWPGINCTNKRVTSINLSNMSLTGTLSPYVGALTFLKSVDLSNNFFTGPIPGDLTSATHLETLNLANNRLDSELPASLGNWTNLTSLNVANNRLVGSIPASIGNLQLLETLNMTGNNLTGAIPQELNLCRKLNQVDLSGNGLQGIVPFQNLTNLTVLRLQGNKLEGDFVTRLDTLFRLEDLDLSYNLLNGTIPTTISNLPLRNQLSLHHNNLTGEIPDALGSLALVLRIDLSYNNLTGGIPNSVGQLLSLQEFNVSLNELHGEIPTSLALLPSLAVLDISKNHIGGLLPAFADMKGLRWFDASFNSLVGPLPDKFVDFAALRYLNVSYNQLIGEVPFFVEHDNVTRQSFMHTRLCGGVIGISCEHRSSHTSTVISIAVGSSVGFVVLFIILYVLCSRHHEKEKQHKKFGNVSTEFELKLTPEQVLRATQNFNAGSKIGEGNMSAVYRGVLPGDTQVAVKKLAIKRGDMNESMEKVLDNGFESLGHIRHWSLVKVLGYCCSPDITALVMEYMPNGTLSNLMYPEQRDTEFVREFNWNHRFNTAIGVAEGLKYLHHECPTPTVHGDLKPSNILFNTFMEARITDFGVAKLLADHGLGARPTLEIGFDNSYKAPESANLAGCTMKGDVYSFGVIVLEMISGRSPRLLGTGVTMPQWIRDTLSDSKALQNILDPILMRELEDNQQKMSMVLGVALLCTREHPQERPYITEVLKMLSHIKSRPQNEGKGSQRFRTSPSTHQRNEEIRQEVPGIEIASTPPITPASHTPAPHLSPMQPVLSHNPSYSGPSGITTRSSQLSSLQSLHMTNPSLSSWTPTAENR
ncbi:hypothetical protein KC19_6G167600 [Ceratodon purpureus]|uniref:Protein kinase domain-containing protein n=1 Tax=Ceratodon purpureus TaxID=3225 RepID=A0A8T0HIH9_CERPU|nr:hypothetical protein KC19_6G167600 [Ceratodon purpureus]